MKIFLTFCLFITSYSWSQTLFDSYMTDTFELSEAYLYEKANGWFEKSENKILLKFEVVEGKEGMWKKGPWISSGLYQTEVEMLSDTSFNFTIQWTNDQGVQNCQYLGILSNSLLIKEITFKQMCENGVSEPGIYSMQGKSLVWPGHVPSGYGVHSGKVISCKVFGLEINEPVVAFDILNEFGDTLHPEIFDYHGMMKISNDDLDYFINKNIEFIYVKNWSNENYFQSISARIIAPKK